MRHRAATETVSDYCAGVTRRAQICGIARAAVRSADVRNVRIAGLWLSGGAPLLLAMAWVSVQSEAPEGMAAFSAGITGWVMSLGGSILLLTSLGGDIPARTREWRRRASAIMKPVAAALTGISLVAMGSLPGLLLETAGVPVLVVGLATGLCAFALLLRAAATP